ncbi:hypothetical protein GW17_00056291 [Ensete ventricosum]|nr:hypothetical protein GW17_00056291 [Ensete ventricosum]
MHALVGYVNLQTMKGGLLKQQPITVFVNIGSTNNFMNSKVAAQMALHIEDCSRFDVKVTDDQILKCDQRCPWVKLLLQDQEILADFFLLPLNDYEVMLDIKWLTMLGSLVRSYRSRPRDIELSLEDKADLKRVSMLGP